ncbi:putative PAS fold [Lyophyllum shimeji]|uniref:PAS fold n=1 Tax=Lyophyllum shimeji TaxID=47721 RepID=A0A9P3UP63_LYOSH|nr:putative PAS fold [Lyophyllum shimeji]
MPDHGPSSVSFIGIVDFSDQARWLFMTHSVTDLLGYEPHELIGRPSLELVHPDEFPRVKQVHYETISKDKAAVLLYLRMKHKVPSRGYILCGVSRTVVHNVLVGSVSFAHPGKAMHNASTAQEVEVVTPSATTFQIKRWHDPSPIAPHPITTSLPTPASPTSSWRSGSSPRSISGSDSEELSPLPALRRQDTISFEHLPNQSLRTLFILDRFTMKGTILYCSNDLLVTTLSAMGRSFYDFVDEKDEEMVRRWIDQVKSWGVNDLGQPSDGGFGYGGFTLLTKGRDSSRSERVPEPFGSHSRHRDRTGRKLASRHSHARVEAGPGASRALHIPGRTHLPPISTMSHGEGPSPQVPVDAIFSAHSDGLMVILRRSENS